jgi:hypothetical protein
MNVEKGERFAMANENRSKQKKKKSLEVFCVLFSLGCVWI